MLLLLQALVLWFATDRGFYDVDLTWDRGSNITATQDNVWPGRDVAYTIDGLSRVTRALESVTGGSNTRDEQWTLSQTGNWHERKLDLDGDLNYNETDELDDCGTFNKANEWTARNTDCAGGDEYSLTYDEVGNLIDDPSGGWKFVYDAFGRLRKIKNTSGGALVEEFTYNGLGYRVGWHYDVDADSDVDASDPWFHFAYDDAWRIVGTFRSSDTNAKELFVAHMAGANGRGGSSALDGVILRDKDANTSWGSATDGSREERAYYCQNWRGDIVTMLKATGGTSCQVYETVRYSSYGVPFGITPGDIEPDGDVDNDDNTNWPGSYQVRCDYDLDGDMDVTDQNFTIANSGRTLGRGVLSHPSVANRKGYCGYEHDAVIDTLAHVRNRVLMTELGRWSRRDPLGYVDGMNPLAYVQQRPISVFDPQGLSTTDLEPDRHPDTGATCVVMASSDSTWDRVCRWFRRTFRCRRGAWSAPTCTIDQTGGAYNPGTGCTCLATWNMTRTRTVDPPGCDTTSSTSQETTSAPAPNGGGGGGQSNCAWFCTFGGGAGAPPQPASCP